MTVSLVSRRPFSTSGLMLMPALITATVVLFPTSSSYLPAQGVVRGGGGGGGLQREGSLPPPTVEEQGGQAAHPSVGASRNRKTVSWPSICFPRPVLQKEKHSK